MPSKLPTAVGLTSCAPPQTMHSCKPCRMSSAPSPMACAPLAQAPEMVRLMPRRRKMQERFIVTVEFIDWKMEPEPMSVVSRFSRRMSMLWTTASAVLSLP